MNEPTSPATDALSAIFRGLELMARIGIGLAIFVAIASLIGEQYAASSRQDVEFYPALGLSGLRFLSAILINVLPVLIVFAFIRPATEKLYGTQIREFNAARDREQKMIFENALQSQAHLVETRLNEFQKIINTKFPIDDFAASFNDLDWTKLLHGAEKAEVAAFYWSHEWLSKNLPVFKAAANSGCTITFYLPNPAEHRSQFTVADKLSEKTKENIFETASTILRANNSGNISVKLVPNAINYMSARLHHGTAKTFAYSPFRNNGFIISGRPPVVVIDENRCDENLRQFIDAEFSQLANSAPLIDPARNKYLKWSDAADRVVVSSSLSCPAPCAFCYVPSVKEGFEREQEDKRVFGELLAHVVCSDDQFKRGMSGTIIFCGGLTDPFHPKNCDVTFDFLETVRKLDCSNQIHVATKYGIPERYRERMRSLSGVLINYSISGLDQNIEFSVGKISERFLEAKSLIAEGRDVALYLRPVIPGVTLTDLEEIIEKSRDAGIRHVTVGGLYVDDKIVERFEGRGVNLPKRKGSVDPRRMILDHPGGSLRKFNQDDVAEVRRRLEQAGFEVFNSSFEISRHFASSPRPVDR